MSISIVGSAIRDVGLPFLTALGTPAQGGSAIIGLLPIAFILLIMYFIVFLPMKRQQRKVQEFRDSLKTGDRVVTSGGLYGQITRVSEQSVSVQLQIADKVRVEVSRNAVIGYQGQEPVAEAEPQNAGSS
jgi:preprotein translocase subunit YajC